MINVCKNCLLKYFHGIIFMVVFLYPSFSVFASISSIDDTDLVIFQTFPDTITVNDTIFLYDTVYTYEYVYDTLYVYDTVEIQTVDWMEIKSAGFDFPSALRAYPLDLLKDSSELKCKILKPLRAFELSYSPFLFQNRIGFGNASTNSFRQVYLNSIHPQLSGNFSLQYIQSLNSWFTLQSGISYSFWKERLLYEGEVLYIDSALRIQETLINEPFVDTIRFYYADAILQGDSSQYVEYYDSVDNWVSRMDSTWIKNDTLNLSSIDTINNWQYLEIPLVASFYWERKRFATEIKTGLITGFLTQTNRTVLYSFGNGIQAHEVSQDETHSILLNVYLGANASYRVTNQFSVLLEPWARLPILQFTSNQYLNNRVWSYGIKLGVRYHW